MKQEPQSAAAAPSSAFKSVKEVEATARTRMDKVLADLQNEDDGHFRTGRASIGLLENVRVDYYGLAGSVEPGGATACARAFDDYGAALGRLDHRRD